MTGPSIRISPWIHIVPTCSKKGFSYPIGIQKSSLVWYIYVIKPSYRIQISFSVLPILFRYANCCLQYRASSVNLILNPIWNTANKLKTYVQILKEIHLKNLGKISVYRVNWSLAYFNIIEWPNFAENVLKETGQIFFCGDGSTDYWKPLDTFLANHG